MKSKAKPWLFHLSTLLAFTVFASNVQADNPLTSLWPFAGSKKPTASFNSPFPATQKSKGNSILGAPSRMMEKAGQQTSTLFKKTKHGMQSFGRSLNPFSKTASKPSKEKRSLLDTFLPKKSTTQPATVQEFLQMDRPGF